MAKEPARLRLGDDADRLVAELFSRLALDYQRAVEVLAALGGEVEPVLLYERIDGVHDGFGGLRGAALAYARAHDLARGAADDDEAARLRRGELQQLLHCGAGLFFYFIVHD